MSITTLEKLDAVAAHLRKTLDEKKYVVLYAYNGTGKTRLSMAFKDAGKKGEARDTLYFNAFTEDLFTWDNDLENDAQRVLRINQDSRFFNGLQDLEMENRIRPLLQRYADFDFKIDYKQWTINFSRDVLKDGTLQTIEHIKVSRGEENIFIWCFFLAVAQLAIDKQEAYQWVKYIYIDDPVSSLDENNAIGIANHLAKLLLESNSNLKTVISTHHVLFFNVLCNELKKKAFRHFLCKGEADSYVLNDTSSKPFLHHLATLVELNELQKTGNLYTHHFNMMRRVMEQTANFFGLNDWTDCIKVEEDDPDKALFKRLIDLMSHGDYSLYEPKEMMTENKTHFRKIFHQFIAHHPFNPELFPAADKVTA